MRNEPNFLMMLLRYVFVLAIGFFGLKYIYVAFTPLTGYPVYYTLQLFYSQVTYNVDKVMVIIGSRDAIQLVEACIGGSAYFFLLALNFTTPMPTKTRIKSILFLVLGFLAINIIRIDIFSALFVNRFQYFDLTHVFFWYIGSTVLVVLLWFLNTRIFKIKEIPVYTDIKGIIEILRKR